MADRGNGVRVLIVEDDPETQANLQSILELDGYQIETAGSVKETLVERDWANLFAIILDRRLRDGTADTLLPTLRDLAPRTPVIVVTGYADLDGAVSVIRHGIADFIPKPVNPDMLRASLARVARIRELEERSRQDERLATIGQMMASVAHESRNALQRILASSELLELTLAGNPEGLKDVASIRRAADDLHSILEEIRCYAAPIQIERHACDVSKVWRGAWRTLEKERTGRHIELVEQTNSCNLQCDVDSTRLEQVFRNLFENSLAACGDTGSVEITCHEQQDNGIENLKIVVRDDGPGLSDDQKSNVFEPFFTTKPEGSGLGMAIAKRIVETHGGRISVANGCQKEGAAFAITLPRIKTKLLA
jgi:signal transduction histidine kinase